MNQFLKCVVLAFGVMAIAILVSLVSGALAAGCALYELGWDEARANAVGNSIGAIVFWGVLLIAAFAPIKARP
jgi:hypothetical protein